MGSVEMILLIVMISHPLGEQSSLLSDRLSTKKHHRGDAFWLLTISADIAYAFHHTTVNTDLLYHRHRKTFPRY